MQTLITFVVGNEEFAADGDDITTILDSALCADAPDSPQRILPSAGDAGNSTAVFHLGHLLGSKESDASDTAKVLIMDNAKGRVGFIVDRVVEMLNVQESQLRYLVFQSYIQRGAVVIKHAFYEKRFLQMIDFEQITRELMRQERATFREER
ncbi:MAG: chemotaxis protein CheW [Ignavibacteria bacterium]|nr:chemotaxis protein CheW [Ignavibacteria bacterium]